MTWLQAHQESERLASEAHSRLRAGDLVSARSLFTRAAEAEVEALQSLDETKARTRGITIVSAVSLWFKAQAYTRAEQLATQWIATGTLPTFAREQLKQLTQEVWIAQAIAAAGTSFLPGRVLVSVRGGQTLPGGAPLDLIVNKVQTVQALFYRTIEFLQAKPHRRHGPPSMEIQESCRPWLFQAAPGSYQFSVAIEEPKQLKFFEDAPSSRMISKHFMSILAASATDPEKALPEIVEDAEYRKTFLKLARNLVPTGKNFSEIEVREESDTHGLVLEPSIRKSISRALRPTKPISTAPSAPEQKEISGILRALHLEEDWLELLVEGQTIRIDGLVDAVDDVIGPWVNRRVVVLTLYDGQSYQFVDIESED